MREDFAVFILCYGRPNRCKTLHTLKRCNYTGKYYLVLSTDDVTLNDYISNFGKEHILIFDKNDIKADRMDNFNNKKCVMYARNACFKLAKQVDVRYFLELDDDYTEIRYRWNKNGSLTSHFCLNADELFESMIDLLNSGNNLYSIAFAQAGDFIGGVDCQMLRDNTSIRKIMNSFFCDINKPFDFIGTFNEDVNTYTQLQSTGKTFLTVRNVAINQLDTQQQSGGMTEIYNAFGTYVKSFYTILCSPSCVKLNVMGDLHYRIHHNVKWNNAIPKIISSKYKKN